MTYAVTRARDVNSEVKWDDTRNTWKRASSPAAEMVLLILRPQRGRCLVDPDMGVDWAKVDKLRTDASATAVSSPIHPPPTMTTCCDDANACDSASLSPMRRR